MPIVEVVPVVALRLDTSTRLPAEIYAYESVAVFPRVSGFVEEMQVDRGSLVHKGQLLARLSAPELAAQRAEAGARLAAARSTYLRTKAAAETPGAVAKHDLEVARAAASAAESHFRALKTLEEYLYVRAPFDGTVTERNVHPGALVGPPSGAGAVPMLRMESVAHLRVTVAVPEADVAAIADGAAVDFMVRAWPDLRFIGVIRRVARAIDVRTRTMPVELDYANEDGRLAPGMYAEVMWPVRRQTSSLFVPTSAVVQTTEKTFVQRVRDGAIDEVLVKRGVPVKSMIEVFADGLEAGDLVLKRGSEELKAGTRVQLRPASPDGGAGR